MPLYKNTPNTLENLSQRTCLGWTAGHDLSPVPDDVRVWGPPFRPRSGSGVRSTVNSSPPAVWVINQTGRFAWLTEAWKSGRVLRRARTTVTYWPSQHRTLGHGGQAVQLEGFGNCAENDAFAATGGYSGMINSTKREKKQANPWTKRERGRWS